MKNKFIFSLWSIVLFLILANFSFGQSQNLPSVNIKDTGGNVFNTSSISNDGKPIIICFWALSSPQSQLLLNKISENYPDWQTETGVKLVAVSIDNARSSANVKRYVADKGWEYEIYFDEEQKFKRSMRAVGVPHTFVLNEKREIVWQSDSTEADFPDKLYAVVKRVANGQKPE